MPKLCLVQWVSKMFQESSCDVANNNNDLLKRVRELAHDCGFWLTLRPSHAYLPTGSGWANTCILTHCLTCHRCYNLKHCKNASDCWLFCPMHIAHGVWIFETTLPLFRPPSKTHWPLNSGKRGKNMKAWIQSKSLLRGQTCYVELTDSW